MFLKCKFDINLHTSRTSHIFSEGANTDQINFSKKVNFTLKAANEFSQVNFLYLVRNWF